MRSKLNGRSSADVLRLAVCGLAFWLWCAPTLVSAQGDPVMDAMGAEMARATGELVVEGAEKPYRVAYTVLDIEVLAVQAGGGALVSSVLDAGRRLSADVRLGDYALDNTQFQFFGGFGAMPPQVPLEDDAGVLQRALWLLTDAAYKDALKSYAQKQAYLRDHPRETEIPDFTRVEGEVYKSPSEAMEVDRVAIEALARRLSGAINAFDYVQGDGVQILVSRLRRRYRDTEGNMTDTTDVSARVVVGASTLAEGGVELVQAFDHLGRRVSDLPDEAALIAEVEAMMARLKALREAPVLEDYDGPVLFEGVAAGQVMRHFLASNVSGTPGALTPGPQFNAGGSGREFMRKRERPVMPKGWTLTDDPTLKVWKKTPLMGHYVVDHEGVPAQKVELVRDGRLKAMLMSRIPSKEQGASNGHGRAPLGADLLGHPSNLIVKAPRGLADKAMRKALLKAANEEGYDFALIVRRLADDAVFVSGSQAAFEMAIPSRDGFPRPLEVVRLNKDGSETPLRGVIFNHVIVRHLREITAVSREPVLYQYLSPGIGEFAGGFAFGPDPSMSVPTSIITPAFILPHVEVVPNKGERRRPPMVPRP